ncbi:MAG TPA: YhjD/YihY/BrkB family envelope integrity protein [Deltaproteobacteria bacterium]|jgi:membrane protein|nr:YhjD/YihY/BrkB family envelope integrity protein [Deltaproteobacteria bacterium]
MGIAARMSSAARFLSTGIWRVRLGDVHGPKRFLIRYLRIVLIAGKGFVQDKCTLWGSALTFYSILSIVPVFALGFAVAKGFGLEILLEDFLVQQFAGYEDVVTQVITFSRRLLARTSGGVIAGVGAAFLIWSVFQILSSAEQSFNNIWEVRRQRTLGRKLSDYLSIMLITPVVLIMSSSSLVFIATKLHDLMQTPGFIWVVSPIIFVLINIIPYILIWSLLTFVYVFLPNTRVNLVSGILGGVIAGTVFVIVQWVYITFQVGVSTYNAIYGSFAALPLFLVWLNVSWFIVLFGAELCYAHQNEELYRYDPEAGKISHSFRMLLSLQVVHLIVKNFMDGGRPLNPNEISERLEIPPRTVREIIDALTGSGLLAAVSSNGAGNRGYQPSRDIDFFTISKVVETLEDRGINDIPVARTESLERISRSLQTFRSMIEHSDANVRLKDI